jgi:hypothetical protein
MNHADPPKKPLVIHSNLPRLVEAVVKSLDPSSTSDRDAVFDAATEILSQIVQTSVFSLLIIFVLDVTSAFLLLTFTLARNVLLLEPARARSSCTTSRPPLASTFSKGIEIDSRRAHSLPTDAGSSRRASRRALRSYGRSEAVFQASSTRAHRRDREREGENLLRRSRFWFRTLVSKLEEPV